MIKKFEAKPPIWFFKQMGLEPGVIITYGRSTMWSAKLTIPSVATRADRKRKCNNGCEIDVLLLSENLPNTACTRRVGVAAFSGRLRGLKLVQAKWHCLVPPASK
jgi:hypothetical protein